MNIQASIDDIARRIAVAEAMLRDESGGEREAIGRRFAAEVGVDSIAPDTRSRLAAWLSDSGIEWPGAKVIQLPAWAKMVRPAILNGGGLQIMVGK